MIARGVLMALAVSTASGCTGGVALDDVPEEFADVFCDLAGTCLGRLADRTGATAGCEASARAGFESGVLARWREIEARGTATYDPDAARTCIDESRALGCSLLIAAEPAACRRIWIGTVPAGGGCSMSEECEGDAYCANEACPDVAGTCTARVGSGSSCETDDACQDGLVCENGMCGTVSSRAGGSCGGTSGLSCPLDQNCVGATSETPGTCTPITEVFAGSAGDPCDFLANDLCSPDLSCALVSEVDMACVAIAPSRGECTLAVPDMCPAGEFCEGVMLAVDDIAGTCAPLPGEGQPCAVSALGASVCAAGLSCVLLGEVPTCVAPRANGETCTTSGECRSGYCDGSCAPPPLCD